jgi:transposase
VRTGLANRARIVLFAGDSTSNTRIAELVRVSRPTVLLWRDRFDEHGIDGLHDEAHAGRPRQVSHERIVTARLGLRNATIGRCWRECSVQPWHSETFKFSTDPELVAKDYPGRELHLVMDNYASHKNPEIRDWLADNPRIHVHFTPTSGSWLNLVEVWFGIIQSRALGRGTFTSVTDLSTKICAFTGGRNERYHPFTWTKTSDQLFAKSNRKKTSNTSP